MTAQAGHKETQAFFSLLKAGLWGQTPGDLSLFPLSGKEWEVVFRLGRYQTVTGILYQGIALLPDELLPPEEFLYRLIAQVDAIERRNRQMNGVLRELYTCFTGLGIRVVLQKGQGVAALYDHPLLRECGDIDFYFPDREERKRADAFVRGKGAAIEKGADGSIYYEWKGIKVEHHSRLIDLYNPFLQGYLKGLERKLGFVEVPLLPDCPEPIRVPSPLLHLLLLNAHILKHALGWGIGLRQLCDMALAYAHWCTPDEAGQLADMYRKVDITKWSCLLHGFLMDYLGAPASSLPCGTGKVMDTKPLYDIIRKGGNFGHARHRNAIVQTTWMRKMETSRTFFQNMRFACKYAPQEAIGLVLTLLGGQFGR